MIHYYSKLFTGVLSSACSARTTAVGRLKVTNAITSGPSFGGKYTSVTVPNVENHVMRSLSVISSRGMRPTKSLAVSVAEPFALSVAPFLRVV